MGTSPCQERIAFRRTAADLLDGLHLIGCADDRPDDIPNRGQSLSSLEFPRASEGYFICKGRKKITNEWRNKRDGSMAPKTHKK